MLAFRVMNIIYLIVTDYNIIKKLVSPLIYSNYLGLIFDKFPSLIWCRIVNSNNFVK